MAGGEKASAVERALLILETLDNSRRGLNISELSRRLRLPKSSTHVIVLTLERLGYLQKRAGTLHYGLGLKAYALGHGMTKNVSASELALPHMRALADHMHLSVQLAVLDGEQCVCIQKVEAPGLIKIDTYIGRRMDLHCTAVGKVILALGPEDVLERILAKQVYIRHTRKTITSAKLIEREVLRIRKSGYAVDDEEEEPGVRCVAVPVYHANSTFAAGLSITGTITQIPMPEIESMAAQLRSAAGAFCAAERAEAAG
jgi:DNA-binding IclR family transcriptional regulator